MASVVGLSNSSASCVRYYVYARCLYQFCDATYPVINFFYLVYLTMQVLLPAS
jgi:hypothetical protein